MVGGDEACDDANDVSDDGCDRDCRQTALVEWTRKDHGVLWGIIGLDVAVDPAGRIVVVGEDNNMAFVMVLDPSGSLVWRRDVPNGARQFTTFTGVTVDEEGRIFAAGDGGVAGAGAPILHAFGPEGATLWTFEEPLAGVGDGIRALALGDGGLYSVGSELQGDDSQDLVVRRHDPATGAVAWKVNHGDDGRIDATGVAVSGSAVAAVGFVGRDEDLFWHSLVVVLDQDGAPLWSQEEDAGVWSGVAAIGDGDLLLAGHGDHDDDGRYRAALRRVGPDGAEVWRFTGDAPEEGFDDVVVGADETIVAVGTSRIADTQGTYSFARHLTGDGMPTWISYFSKSDALRETAKGVDFGPGFAVAAGYWDAPADPVEGSPSHMWVRRFAVH
ncbi:hypothetical protein OV203_34190 [Nannocystis sp. ILAH1]|uniref:hypothetical protein n=1 Tax=unclassified Nannocystis TaxID=2627009 RepID=UPI00226E04A0|nr:hypothetical protein [Nannocystis sp. ILAH1]MCY1069174.1 hypothetical protein [Nannocystis sp. RBIL2]